MQETVAELSPDALRSHIVSSPAYPDVEERKVISAIWSIDRLKALGKTEFEISELISEPGEWNERYGVWENVNDVIVFDTKEKGMDDFDLEREVMLKDLRDATVWLAARNSAQALLYGIYREVILDQHHP